MADAMLDARHEGDLYRRIEVITGQSRRRRWTAEEKARIVAERLALPALARAGATLTGTSSQSCARSSSIQVRHPTS